MSQSRKPNFAFQPLGLPADIWSFFFQDSDRAELKTSVYSAVEKPNRQKIGSIFSIHVTLYSAFWPFQMQLRIPRIPTSRRNIIAWSASEGTRKPLSLWNIQSS